MNIEDLTHEIAARADLSLPAKQVAIGILLKGGGRALMANNSEVASELGLDEHTVRLALVELDLRRVLGVRISNGVRELAPVLPLTVALAA